MSVVRFVMEGTGDPLFAVNRLDHMPAPNNFVEYGGATYKVETVTLKINQEESSAGMKNWPGPGWSPPETVIAVSIVP